MFSQNRRIRQLTSLLISNVALTLGGILLTTGVTAQAAGAPEAPKVTDALKLTPVQKDVEYDRPTAEIAAKCTIKAEKIGNQTGWVIRDPSGTILREFVDSNGDNIVDRWSYYLDGVEVYRDIDSDFNGKADAYRWLNTAGTRWGIGKKEDGTIDSWKQISAEEVTSEIVAAIRTKDQKRFERLLLSPAELKNLGQGDDKAKTIADKIAKASATFSDLVKTQKAITPKSVWINFAASKPGLVPAGTGGSTADLSVYENVVAMSETEGKHGQIMVGTLVKVGDVWRVIDAPKISNDAGNEFASAGFFFASNTKPLEKIETANPPSDSAQAAIAELEKIDSLIAKSNSAKERADLHERRADMLEKLVETASEKDRAQWAHQLADAISAAVQSGEYPKGIDRLRAFQEQLAKGSSEKDLVAYVRFRTMTAEYAQAIQAPGADFAKVQEAWLLGLEKFVGEFPKTPDGAEAMLQLGIAQEFAGQEEKAKKWYDQILTNYPGTVHAKKATGSIARLNSVGKPLALKGKMVDGKEFDVSQLRGKVVLVQYFAAWCEPAKADMAQLKDLQAKYAKEGFAVVSVSLDSETKILADYLAQEKGRLAWPVLFEQGGLESRYALEMGIHTLPTMILLDAKGKVVSRSVHISELDAELKAQFR